MIAHKHEQGCEDQLYQLVFVNRAGAERWHLLDPHEVSRSATCAPSRAPKYATVMVTAS